MPRDIGEKTTRNALKLLGFGFGVTQTIAFSGKEKIAFIFDRRAANGAENIPIT